MSGIWFRKRSTVYCRKLIQLGAKVVTMSDSDGYIYDPDGIDREKLDYIMELKNLYRGRIREYAENTVASM